MNRELDNETIRITDLGYVGLPRALAFSKHPGVVGFDVDSGHDHRLKR